MKLRLINLLLLLGLIFTTTSGVSAQSTLSFSLDREVVEVFWNANGTMSLDYTMTFSNSVGAPMIDYVDMGMPNSHFDLSTVKADVTADMMSQYPTPVSTSDYQGSGSGFAVHLILPIYGGQSGILHVLVGAISRVLYKDTDHPDTDASAVFSPQYFGSKYVHGGTDMKVTFHLPPGVQPDEPRYHTPESNWPGVPVPVIGRDGSGNITYTWQSSDASGSEKYTFGASFPKKYVPSDAVRVKPLIDFSGFSAWMKNFGRWMANYSGAVIAITCNVVPWAAIGIAVLIGGINEKRRKLQYLPPRISIEGHGVKRGLTAVEAGLLMQEPLDKIMTMILFGVIKKNAATVTKKDPLKVEAAVPLPAGLYDYETEFLVALADDKVTDRRKDLQEMTINLVKSVSEKMKGFSRKETVAYYKAIMERAWQEIEQAGTPEVKSQLYGDSLEWTMLDRNYDKRMQNVFSGPFFVPSWWGHYDPAYRPAATTVSTGSKTGAALPGAALAASVVTSVQGLSSKVLGDVKTFTSGISDKTNPAPVSSSSGGGGGHSSSSSGHSSCACACAGCACACAGGGR
jgi:hypothetical protein